jgi:hypothetical protein
VLGMMEDATKLITRIRKYVRIREMVSIVVYRRSYMLRKYVIIYYTLKPVYC